MLPRASRYSCIRVSVTIWLLHHDDVRCGFPLLNTLPRRYCGWNGVFFPKYQTHQAPSPLRLQEALGLGVHYRHLVGASSRHRRCIVGDHIHRRARSRAFRCGGAAGRQCDDDADKYEHEQFTKNAENDFVIFFHFFFFLSLWLMFLSVR